MWQVSKRSIGPSTCGTCPSQLGPPQPTPDGWLRHSPGGQKPKARGVVPPEAALLRACPLGQFVPLIQSRTSQQIRTPHSPDACREHGQSTAHSQDLQLQEPQGPSGIYSSDFPTVINPKAAGVIIPVIRYPGTQLSSPAWVGGGGSQSSLQKHQIRTQ